jgi:hypothetical protein
MNDTSRLSLLELIYPDPVFANGSQWFIMRAGGDSVACPTRADHLFLTSPYVVPNFIH